MTDNRGVGAVIETIPEGLREQMAKIGYTIYRYKGEWHLETLWRDCHVQDRKILRAVQRFLAAYVQKQIWEHRHSFMAVPNPHIFYGKHGRHGIDGGLMQRRADGTIACTKCDYIYLELAVTCSAPGCVNEHYRPRDVAAACFYLHAQGWRDKDGQWVCPKHASKDDA